MRDLVLLGRFSASWIGTSEQVQLDVGSHDIVAWYGSR
jgi:hypothetical protein